MPDTRDVVVRITTEMDDETRALLAQWADRTPPAAPDNEPWELSAARFVQALDPETIAAVCVSPPFLHMGAVEATLAILAGWLTGALDIEGRPR